jgi:hypothetical protein
MASKQYRVGQGAGGVTGRAAQLAKQTRGANVPKISFSGSFSGSISIPDAVSIVDVTFTVEESTPIEARLVFNTPMNTSKGLVNPNGDWLFSEDQANFQWRYDTATWISPTVLKLTGFSPVGIGPHPQQDQVIYEGSGADQIRSASNAVLPTGYSAPHPGY